MEEVIEVFLRLEDEVLRQKLEGLVGAVQEIRCEHVTGEGREGGFVLARLP